MERRRSSELGTTTLLVAAMILPIFFMLFSLSSDVGNYYTKRRYIQRIIDEAVVFGERYLPYTDAAESAMNAYLSRYPFITEGALNLQATPGSITARFEADIPLAFPRLLGVETTLPILIESGSMSLPLDAFIMVDTSAYLSPDITTADAWNPGVGDQVAMQTTHPFIPNPENNEVSLVFDRKVAAEQCQNSEYRPLKLAAIRSFEYLSGFSLNQIGVGFYPIGDFTEVVRDMAAPSQDSSGARFQDREGTYFRSNFCAQLAQVERDLTNGDDFYSFPAQQVKAAGVWAPSDSDNFDMLDAFGRYDTAYDQRLTVREVIWAQPTKQNNGQSILTPSVDRLLDQVAAQMFGDAGVAARGSLAHRARKLGVIFAGDMPWFNGSRLIQSDGTVSPEVRQATIDALTLLRDRLGADNDSMGLLYVVYRHRGNEANFDRGREELASIFAGVTTDEFKPKVIASEDPRVITERIAGYVGKENRIGLFASSKPTR